MRDVLLKIYDFFRAHTRTRHVSLLIATMLLLALSAHLGFKEDISDFIPLEGREGAALRMYQNISGANRIFVSFQQTPYAGTGDRLAPEGDHSVDADPSLLAEAASCYADMTGTELALVDVRVQTAQTDMIDDVMGLVFSNIPYLLQDSDYDRIDSLLRTPGFVLQQLEDDMQLLMSPSGAFHAAELRRDPLRLFAPIGERLQDAGGQGHYEIYDGQIFTPDMQRAIVIIDTPYGASESKENSRVLELLEHCSDSLSIIFPTVKTSVFGSPVMAVGNASRIKTDSLLSVCLAGGAILALLLYVFRSVRNILLIAFSIVWGWLFALASLSLLRNEVSIIVIGISSVILGIAVNYPLHVISHISHEQGKRRSIKEIITPLLVGNITTIGAFLTLVPLQSVALRDLGLFASLLLLGTIIFALVFLPHMTEGGKSQRRTFIDRLSELHPERRRSLVCMIVVLTVALGYFSVNLTFDSDMSHINYLSDEDKANMSYFQQMMNEDSLHTPVYAVSSGRTLSEAVAESETMSGRIDSLLQSGEIGSYSLRPSNVIVSDGEQKHRLERWAAFVKTFNDSVRQELTSVSMAQGFSENAFSDFNEIVGTEYQPKDIQMFMPLVDILYSGCVSYDSINGEYHVIDMTNVKKEQERGVECVVSEDGSFYFSPEGISSAIANSLSDNFNYIGWACGLIVFFFLWISMGSLELAIISFVPMAVSWLWILGLMSLLGIQFNIVNIILATFIFGQGDDYTIFMTEGASYEYAYRRRILPTYKHSIIVSALIMFVGIGSLIIARHPALHSLAEVTIVGMFSVVLMAYTLPPLLFEWLVRTKNGYRLRPLCITALLRGCYAKLRYALGLSAGIRIHLEGKDVKRCHDNVTVVYNNISRIDRQIIKALIPQCGDIIPADSYCCEMNTAVGIPGVQFVVIHGSDLVCPGGGWTLYSGDITVTLLETTDIKQMKPAYDKICRERESVEYYRDLIVDRFRYKGRDEVEKARQALSKNMNSVRYIPDEKELSINDAGNGAMALAWALLNPDKTVYAEMESDEKASLLRYSAEGVVSNLIIKQKHESV